MKYLLLIIAISFCITAPLSFAVNTTQPNNTIPLSDLQVSANYSSSDMEFLFLMNQYWIPDIFDIKGRLDGSISYGQDFPQMLNITHEFAKTRLIRNINETNGYNLSPGLSNLRGQYQTCAMRGMSMNDEIMRMNRSAETFVQEVQKKTAGLSLYGSWLEYQVMQRYDMPGMRYPDIAQVPPDQFLAIMGNISP